MKQFLREVFLLSCYTVYRSVSISPVAVIFPHDLKHSRGAGGSARSGPSSRVQVQAIKRSARRRRKAWQPNSQHSWTRTLATTHGTRCKKKTVQPAVFQPALVLPVQNDALGPTRVQIADKRQGDLILYLLFNSGSVCFLLIICPLCTSHVQVIILLPGLPHHVEVVAESS